MDIDDTDRAQRHAEMLLSLVDGFSQQMPVQGDYHEISVFLAREQTAALLTLLTTALPKLQDLHLSLIDTNARLEKIERMIQDLWAAHS